MQEFLQALDAYQVMLMSGKYSLTQLAEARKRLIDIACKKDPTS